MAVDSSLADNTWRWVASYTFLANHFRYTLWFKVSEKQIQKWADEAEAGLTWQGSSAVAVAAQGVGLSPCSSSLYGSRPRNSKPWTPLRSAKT